MDAQTWLCDIPLSYTVAKAAAAGLAFDPLFPAQAAEFPAEYSLDKYADGRTFFHYRK